MDKRLLQTFLRLGCHLGDRQFFQHVPDLGLLLGDRGPQFIGHNAPLANHSFTQLLGERVDPCFRQLGKISLQVGSELAGDSGHRIVGPLPHRLLHVLSKRGGLSGQPAAQLRQELRSSGKRQIAVFGHRLHHLVGELFAQGRPLGVDLAHERRLNLLGSHLLLHRTPERGAKIRRHSQQRKHPTQGEHTGEKIAAAGIVEL